MWYISLSLTIIVVASIATLSIASLYLYFSQDLHNKMLNSVTRSPILFFDSNPLGRIINRFSKDTAVSDGTLPEQAYIFSGVSSLSPSILTRLDLMAVHDVHCDVSDRLPLPCLYHNCGLLGNVLCTSEVPSRDHGFTPL